MRINSNPTIDNSSKIISGEIKRITYFNKDNSFAIIRLNTDTNHDDNAVTAAGIFPDCAMIGTEKVKGLTCSLTGRWVKNKKYGWQFSFTQIKLDNSGLFFFLTNIVKGLGASLSQKLIDSYGENNLIDILDNHSDELLKFKGIKEKKLLKITASWNKYKQMKSLSDFFAVRGGALTSSMILRIYNHFKNIDNDTVGLIGENPYILTEVRGIGFKTCDKIALSIGIDKYSRKRIKALIDYILLSQASGSGHTYLSSDQLMKLAEEYLYNEENTIKNKELSAIINNVIANSDDYFNENNLTALKAYKYKEDYIRKFVKLRSEKGGNYKVSGNEAVKFISKKQNQLGIILSKEQYDAVFNIATKGISVFLLCGYAGTGKSTISKIILDFYSEYFFSKEDITCCAFSGMASKRIKDLTRYSSSTIHSLLGFKSGGFLHNQDNRLTFKIVLLDEASMVNLSIFYALIRAVDDNAVFIMVGDDAQLPPIGAGNIFNDLLTYDIPKVKLTKIYRQSEDSVLTYFAGYIREGEIPEGYAGSYSDWAFDKRDIPNYFALKEKLSDKQMKEVRDNHYEQILNTLINRINRTAQDNHLTGIRKIWDLQVITAMRATLLGTNNLNGILQERLNTGSSKSAVIRTFLLKQYDKVIHLKNKNMEYVDYSDFKNGNTGNKKTTRIYNGNLGIVIDINEEDEEFYVLYPDNITVIYSFDDYKNIIDLGYALTIHKTQGNQFKYVFIPLVNSFFIMLNSKLMYTAVTRAIKQVYLIGQDYAFRRGCTNIKETVRQTFLLRAQDQSLLSETIQAEEIL